MINIKAVIPEGKAMRVYNFEVNGFKFQFTLENDEQAGKEAIVVLRDELNVIVKLIEKGLEQAPTAQTEQLGEGAPKVTLDEFMNKNGDTEHDKDK